MQIWTLFQLISKHSLNILNFLAFFLWIINEFEKRESEINFGWIQLQYVV